MYRYVFYILIPILFLCPVSLQGVIYDTDRTEEVFLTFRYRQVVNTYITALYYHNTVYLPLGDLFHTLQINHHIDINAGVASGFFLSEENRYTIDFNNGKAGLGRESFLIDTTHFVQSDYEIYILPELFEKIFDLRFTVHLGQLTLNLFTAHTVPVVERHQRRLQNRYTQSIRALQPHAPLKYDRNRSWLNGGVLDYRLSTIQSFDGRQQYSYAFKSGIEIAGGDLQVSTFGGYSTGTDHRNTTRYRWRYAFDENQYLTQVSLGEVFTGGIVRTSMHGVQVTNQPVEPRRVLATYSYFNTTEPEWEVELYINDRLFATTVADETGHYGFDIPLIYGSSRLEIKTYGPGGGYHSVRRRIDIPYTFLPPGDVHYTINAGKTFYTDHSVVQARTSAGISKWMSISAGMEYHSDIYGDRPVGIGSVTFRPGVRYIVDLDVAPSLYYRSSVNIISGLRSRIGFDYTNYAGSFNRFNRSGMQHAIDARASFPFTIGLQELFFRYRGSYQKYEFRSNVRTGFDISTSVNRMVVSAGVHISHQSFSRTDRTQSDISAGFNYRFRGDHLLSNAIIRSRIYYNTYLNSFDNVTVAIGRSIGGGGRIEGQYTWNGRFGGHAINVRLTFDLPTFRSSTNAWQRHQRTTFSQQFNGSIAYDSNNRDIIFLNTLLSGSGMSSIRFFIDEDGSGSYEEGEPVVANVPVQFRNAVRSNNNGEGIARAYRLRPYNRYSVEIKEDKIPNPLLVPAFNSFSFIADPHSFKHIDVPVQVTGEISGQVIRPTSSGHNGVNGIRLTIRNADNGQEHSIRTFSDGTYYHMGLPPGTYIVTIDSTQLTGSDLIPKPGAHVVTIEASRYGDYVEGLNFELREKSEPVEPDAGIFSGDYLNNEFFTEPGNCIYVVRKYPLESLWVIAKSMYGSPFLWPKIWLSNYRKIEHPDLIYPGQIFTIPPKSQLTYKERNLRDQYYLQSH